MLASHRASARMLQTMGGSTPTNAAPIMKSRTRQEHIQDKPWQSDFDASAAQSTIKSEFRVMAETADVTTGKSAVGTEALAAPRDVQQTDVGTASRSRGESHGGKQGGTNAERV